MSLVNNGRFFRAYLILAVLLTLAFLISVRYGAVDLDTGEILSGISKAIHGRAGDTLNERVLLQIRLPRALLCVFTGGSLAVGGVLLQGLFRNPIVEPGLIGTSSGAAFGAALYFVLGSFWHADTGEWTLPLAACLGGVLSTAIVAALSQRGAHHKNNIVVLLLTGIAINALFLSGVGFLSYTARDPQARSITFWNLGTLSGASWHSVAVVGACSCACIIASLRLTKGLNALMLGADEARLLGINTGRLRLSVLLINVIMISVATAFTGVISFIGLVVPHLLRMTGRSDNRYLVIGSALLGGVLLSVADVAARMILRPAELPIGIVTSIIGAPVFLVLLRQKKHTF